MKSNQSAIYSFKGQLAIGLAGEAILDRYFSEDYFIKNAEAFEQKLDIDRCFCHKTSGRVLKIKYKTDYQAHKTGNAFVETISFSMASQQKQGWVYTCQADWLVYYCYHLGKAYVIEPKYLKEIVKTWALVYSERRVLNEGWITSGIPVPLCKFRLAAYRVLRVGG